MNSDDTVLEIGGGIGILASVASQVCKSVISFEGCESSVKIAQAIKELNSLSKVKFVPNLVSGDGSEKQFALYENFMMNSTERTLGEEKSIHTVTSVSLKSALECRPDILVVDIEGGEKDLFYKIHPGALRSCRHIIVETHDHIVGLSGLNRLFMDLSACGFCYEPRIPNNHIVTFTNMALEGERKW
ncbi:FkbM family methyltransferase [Epibacterium ulvae]|uniref:FkbM family methyltransferase n=1 Tax=Epibacterium ulvae TaxID=1156985 RepID=UPI0034E23D78